MQGSQLLWNKQSGNGGPEFRHFLSFKEMLAIVVKQEVVFIKLGTVKRVLFLASSFGHSPSFVWECICEATMIAEETVTT